ncbi:hypothetical protein LH464_24155 [Neorhizobium sp. T786]|uniref:hypothetical protein n=1 Tax=Pseudorhizobium xiangyangii TaxID=2883104 RepID=UPI001CFF59FD|nr:hypothetical protein [Neorhizobium xiangyangii]MCB5205533.1 hypothetical protein [Neorhizobium xiangyangii]
MTRIANPHTHDQVVQAEIANEILNTAHSIIYERMNEIEAKDPVEAARLFEKSREIHALQRSFDVVDDSTVEEIITVWGERLKDPDSFLRDL